MVSNLVPVSKPDGGICICIDFRDLNKSCPKDDFPLPKIDMIVDMMGGHEMLSLMDRFFKYNQIMIAKEDRHKMAFTFPWGTYCWNMISFGLKKVGATYQRDMTLIFHDMIHKTMEDYVDDVLENSKKRQDHIAALSAIFDKLEEYKVCLNPKKFIFGIQSGKLLGYILSMRGIEIDPSKVKEILKMEAPKTLK